MSGETTGVDAFFKDLVDAVRFAQSWSESVERQGEAKKELERQLGALSQLQTKVASLLEDIALDPEIRDPLAKAINDFLTAAAQQSKGKINQKQKKTIDDLGAESNSLKVKAVKSLESFLATTPLPVLDEEVALDYSEGSYATYTNYKCAGDIEYQFLLNTANSALFKTDLAASNVWKGLKVPVRLSKAWLKKEPVPDFEKLEDYALTTARASGNHLSATLTNQETAATVTIVFSRSNNESFLTIEYTDKAGKVDVTGEPSLNRHLDLGSVKQAMGKLLDEMVELDREKLRLAKLSCAGKDIIGTLDCIGLMRRVAGILSKSADAMERIKAMDSKGTKERLKLLGANGDAISNTLGLGPQRRASRSSGS